LLYRYLPGSDGLRGGEGAFLPCSFWLVQALALTGRRAEAFGLFTELLRYVSPLGLLPEEIDPATGAYLGNYPQALTHAALVQASLALRASGPDADSLLERRQRRAASAANHQRRSRAPMSR
jgi:GH15 family glucan-1,4-alpha-glucosidase